MSSWKKYTAWIILLVGIVFTPAALEVFNLRQQVFTPSVLSKLVNDLLDRPEELGHFIHHRAVQKLIEEQEASSFKKVPKHLVLFSFIDPDEWERVIRFTINRKQLSADIETSMKALFEGSEIILTAGPYVSHLKRNLPALWEMYHRVLPRCNKKQEAWFGSNRYLPPGSNKSMPKCLPDDPHRTRIKNAVFAIADKKFAAAPEKINVTEKLKASRGFNPKEAAARLSRVKTMMGLIWILPFLMIPGGGFLASDENRGRLKMLAVGLCAAGVISFLLMVFLSLLPLPAAVLAGSTFCLLALEGALMLLAAIALGIMLRKSAHGR